MLTGLSGQWFRDFCLLRDRALLLFLPSSFYAGKNGRHHGEGYRYVHCPQHARAEGSGAPGWGKAGNAPCSRERKCREPNGLPSSFSIQAKRTLEKKLLSNLRLIYFQSLHLRGEKSKYN